MGIQVDKVYTNGLQDVVPYEVCEERGTVAYDIITGSEKGKTNICSTTTFKQQYELK